jgi:hypothetical protein
LGTDEKLPTRESRGDSLALFGIGSLTRLAGCGRLDIDSPLKAVGGSRQRITRTGLATHSADAFGLRSHPEIGPPLGRLLHIGSGPHGGRRLTLAGSNDPEIALA